MFSQCLERSFSVRLVSSFSLIFAAVAVWVAVQQWLAIYQGSFGTGMAVMKGSHWWEDLNFGGGLFLSADRSVCGPAERG